MVTSYSGFIPGPSLDWSGLDILRIERNVTYIHYKNNVLTIWQFTIFLRYDNKVMTIWNMLIVVKHIESVDEQMMIAYKLSILYHMQ